MSMILEIMQVIYTSNPDGGLVEINVTDFDPEKHMLPDQVEEVKKRGRPSKKAAE